MEFNIGYTLIKAYLGQYFNEDFKPSINLWLNKKGWKDLVRDHPVKMTIRAKSKTKIQKNQDLDQCYLQGKRSLKLMKETYDRQPQKA